MSVAELHTTIEVPPAKKTPFPFHLYLQESEGSVSVDKKTVTSQTDAFLEAEPEKPYVPPKSGFDAGTQVDNASVFNFDRDVEPLLDVVSIICFNFHCVSSPSASSSSSLSSV